MVVPGIVWQCNECQLQWFNSREHKPTICPGCNSSAWDSRPETAEPAGAAAFVGRSKGPVKPAPEPPKNSFSTHVCNECAGRGVVDTGRIGTTRGRCSKCGGTGKVALRTFLRCPPSCSVQHEHARPYWQDN
jgi:hypothetical protein